MPNLRTLASFVVRFVLCFGLLLFPWSGFRTAVGQTTRGELRWLLQWVMLKQSYQVDAVQKGDHFPGDSKVVLSNPTNLGPDGLARDRVMVFDSRSLVWLPHAMFLALWAATPLRVLEKWKLLVFGFFGTHLLVLITLLVAVLFAATTANPNGVYRILLAAAHRLMVDNLWSSFVLPFILWLALFIGNTPEHRLKT